MGNLIYNIKPNDWHTVQDAISKLAHKLGPTSEPTVLSLTVSSTATISALVCTTATISTMGVDSATIIGMSVNSALITSLSVTSVAGFANCIAVNSLPAGTNYELVFHIPDIHFYLFG